MTKYEVREKLRKAAKLHIKEPVDPVINHARLLLDQANTAGGWEILESEIINFIINNGT